jgi:hypothetical protein
LPSDTDFKYALAYEASVLVVVVDVECVIGLPSDIPVPYSIVSCVECESPTPGDFSEFATVMVTVPESPAITVPGETTTLPLTTASEGLVSAAYAGTDKTTRSTARMPNNFNDNLTIILSHI